jgi:hypothetical protein
MAGRFHLRDRWLRWTAIVSCALVLASVCSVASADGQPPPAPFENRGLAIVNGGVLWFDEGALLLQGPRWGLRRLGTGSSFPKDFSSSETAIATLDENVRASGEPHFLASVLPRRLSSIAQPHRLRGAGCTWWEPSADFVVVEDDLVAAGECQEVTERPPRAPLFIRSLRGGRWRALRWIAGVSSPELAAEGPLLAVGAHRLDRRMTVTVLDLDTGAVQARFRTPIGRLAFASPRRLVLEVPDRHGLAERRRPVRLRLYSSHGSYLRNLGVMTEPLVSGMHIVAYENGALSVKSVGGGSARPIVGFNPPAREVKAFAFRWPELVVSETTSKPLLASEVNCWSGSYGRSSKPFLAPFDLARVEPFDAPPATAHVEPAVPLTNCGPAPP